MKVNKNIRKVLSLIVLAAVLLTMFGSTVFAADPISVTVKIQGYNNSSSGIILNEYQVTLNDSTGFTAYNALDKACRDNSISLIASGRGYSTYVSGIGGQAEAYFTPNSSYYSGWMFRVLRQSDPTSDELPSVGCGGYTMQNGDKMTWYYAIPAESWYTCISNSSSIASSYAEGSSIAVNVKAEKFTDIMNWSMTGFNNLSGATVVLAKASDGQELASAVTDSNGNAVITAPDVSENTQCYLYVKNKFFTSGNLNKGLQHVKSWRKNITVAVN